MFGGSYRQRDQEVESFESYEDGIEVLSLARALAKYDWISIHSFVCRVMNREVYVESIEC